MKSFKINFCIIFCSILNKIMIYFILFLQKIFVDKQCYDDMNYRQLIEKKINKF